MEDNQQWVVYLSGPRNIQLEQGRRFAGSTDISAVRLRTAMQVAEARNLPIYASIKSTDEAMFRRDVAHIGKAYPKVRNRIITECGASHSLDNAWFAHRFVYRRGIMKAVLVTSEWHAKRAMETFTGMGQAIGSHLGCTVDLEVVSAPFSHRRRVYRFERFVMMRAEEWKREEDRRQVARYAEALALRAVDGFPPRPDELIGYKHVPGRSYLSVTEQETKAQHV